jgi:hypothetical protein
MLSVAATVNRADPGKYLREVVDTGAALSKCFFVFTVLDTSGQIKHVKDPKPYHCFMGILNSRDIETGRKFGSVLRSDRDILDRLHGLSFSICPRVLHSIRHGNARSVIGDQSDWRLLNELRVYSNYEIHSNLNPSILVLPEDFAPSAHKIENFLTRLGVIQRGQMKFYYVDAHGELNEIQTISRI